MWCLKRFYEGFLDVKTVSEIGKLRVKNVNVVSQVLKCVGYTKPVSTMYALHNLHGQLSQYQDFIFFLKVDGDGTSLISLGTKFHN